VVSVRRRVSMKRRKLWLGLTTAILVTPQASALADAASSSAPDVPDQQVASNAPIMLAQHSHPAKRVGGEGEGEGAGSANLAPALRFYRDIQLVRGHLLVADQLIKDGRWNEAFAHVQHPGEEIYGRIRGELMGYDVPPFETALKALVQAVKAKNKKSYAAAAAAVEERLAAADKSLRAKETNWPFFVMETALETLRTAANEYEEAVKGGRISNIVEYQDSRGFVWQAERLFGTVADDLGKKDPEAVSAVRTTFADLKKAWPKPAPPRTPVKDLAAVLGDISRIELQLNRFR
jgi:hypothetical protein